MGLSRRWRRRIGPLPLWLNASWSEANGWSYSWTIKLLGVSYNTRTRASTVDLPGGFKYRHRR